MVIDFTFWFRAQLIIECITLASLEYQSNFEVFRSWTVNSTLRPSSAKPLSKFDMI